MNGGQRAGGVDGAWVLEEQLPPTMREKRIVKVGWEKGGGGGCWISEFDTTWAGVDEEENLLPEGEELGRLRLCRMMGERCEVLRERFRGVWYEDLRACRGCGFFNAWEEKEKETDGRGRGVVGRLERPEETGRGWLEACYRVG